ncbi:hypothetical protein N7455_001332 [Penicillium solitum]|uniref:uncharacterized protein n=1 Tax=Penicillium solitum TaxID=60172 RepID=UPI00182A4853|nr:hypothetical protein HAV15_008164 [Penicillium sp. str. \
MTGQTIPCFDQLGVKPDFSPNQPGLFRDFDQITLYRVQKEELERDMARFRPGSYKFQYEDITFDMAAHNRLLEQTKDEVAAFKSRQATAQVKMLALEKESMDRWMAEKAQNKIPVNEISLLRQDGDIVSSTQVVTILEAMKMEVAVSYNGDRKDGIDLNFRVGKVLVQTGDTIRAGDTLVFLRNI